MAAVETDEPQGAAVVLVDPAIKRLTYDVAATSEPSVAQTPLIAGALRQLDNLERMKELEELYESVAESLFDFYSSLKKQRSPVPDVVTTVLNEPLSEPSASKFKVGDSVKARWKGGTFYPGKVKQVLPNRKYVIDFNDGDCEAQEPEDDMELFKFLVCEVGFRKDTVCSQFLVEDDTLRKLIHSVNKALCDCVAHWPLHMVGVMNGGGTDLNNAYVRRAVRIVDGASSRRDFSPKTKLDSEKAASLLIDAIPLFLSKHSVVLLQEVNPGAAYELSKRCAAPFIVYPERQADDTDECQALVAAAHSVEQLNFKGIVHQIQPGLTPLTQIQMLDGKEQAERLLHRFLPDFVHLDSPWGIELLRALEGGRVQVLIVDGTFCFNVHWYHMRPAKRTIDFSLTHMLAFFLLCVESKRLLATPCQQVVIAGDMNCAARTICTDLTVSDSPPNDALDFFAASALNHQDKPLQSQIKASFSAARDSLLEQLRKNRSDSVMWGVRLTEKGHPSSPSKFEEVHLFREVVSSVVSSFAPGVFFTSITGTKKKVLVQDRLPYDNALVSTLTCDHPILTL